VVVLAVGSPAGVTSAFVEVLAVNCPDATLHTLPASGKCTAMNVLARRPMNVLARRPM
jgi:hypothetical protein